MFQAYRALRCLPKGHQALFANLGIYFHIFPTVKIKYCNKNAHFRLKLYCRHAEEHKKENLSTFNSLHGRPYRTVSDTARQTGVYTATEGREAFS